MEQYQNYADQRYGQTCIYCHEKIETREHTPSRVFLDEPYPNNLPVVGACKKCNNGFSINEEYMACLIECVICGSTDIDKLKREKIKRILSSKPALREKLSQTITEKEGVIFFSVEIPRIRQVVRKIALCHILYEFNIEVDVFDDNSCSDSIYTIPSMTKEDIQAFEDVAMCTIDIWPEVGSRAMQRLVVAGEQLYNESWIEVQEGRYRYCVRLENDVIEVRMVFSDYLACIVRCSE